MVNCRVAGRNRGWPNAAIVRYNQPHARIKNDRIDNAVFDDEYWQKQKMLYQGKKKQKIDEMVEIHKTTVNKLEGVTDWDEVQKYILNSIGENEYKSTKNTSQNCSKQIGQEVKQC